MTKYIKNLISVGILFFFVFYPSLVLAHFDASDHSISADMHIDPNDNPQPQKQAILYFSFTDTAAKTAIADCDCEFSIYENGKQVNSQALKLADVRKEGDDIFNYSA